MSAERVSLLPWDTTFFGASIARIDGASLRTKEELSGAIDACRSQGVLCAYCLVPAEDATAVRALEARGARFVDVRLTLDFQLAGASSGSDVRTRPAAEGDVEALRALAGASHLDSRFYADPRFARERCDELYRVWIEKCVRDARSIVVTEGPEGRPAGYVSCKVEDGVGSIGLVGVHPDHRGHGVGGRLLEGALRWAKAAGATEIVVVTQVRNIAAQRLYQRAGFRTRAAALWFHLWLDELRT